MPALSTLRKWAQKIKVHPGILDEVIKMMKSQGAKEKTYKKICVLSFDELYISQHIEIDRQAEKKIGPHKTVQVGMVRGLFDKWKQVVYYNYDDPLKKETIDKIICKLYDVGYIVVAVTADQGSTNASIWQHYNVGIKDDQNCYFLHPRDNTLKVFVFADPPHLLKCIRNHLLDNGYTLPNKTYIDKRWLEKLLQFNKNDLKITYKLEQKHLDVTGSERQNVAYAAKVLSNNTSESIRWCGKNGYFLSNDYYDGWNDCADFIKISNDWFDVLNSEMKFRNMPQKCAFGVELKEQDEIIDKMSNLMKNSTVGNHKSLLPFQKGIILTNKSLKDLLKYLKGKYSSQVFQFLTY